ncbi:MAG: sodium-dependent bicarbonate transport family permease [Alphaproteobacteria bacterium]|nr:sodium-dependent bicarbonate transport family permease [Alphaproteobacteria bacterium]
MLEQLTALAALNLSSPVVLFFALGIAAALLRSDLTVPDAFAKGLTIYLMLAIGFKGGVAIAKHGLTWEFAVVAATGILIGVLIPVIAFFLLRATSKLDRISAAAVAAHYGSVSIVTFVAASTLLTSLKIEFDGFMVAVTALMETPAIIAGLWLANAGSTRNAADKSFVSHELMREVLLNGSVVLLMGAFFVGVISGEKGMEAVSPFVDAPFKGILCLFMLDMGLLAGRRLMSTNALSFPLVLFALYMPLIGASLGLAASMLIGLSPGTTMLLMTLCASSSYIAVPAAMRIALPQANPAVYLTLSLAITFPFNLTLGLPLYFFAAGGVMP